MKKIVLIICVTLLISCAGQDRVLFKPAPGYDVIQNNPVFIDDIIETKGGPGNLHLPEWLLVFFNGGIEEVEKMDFLSGKYCFIGINEGSNFSALNKWVGNYSVIHDFSRLAAVRIEKKLISAATLYPDDEYGNFYEIMIKKAFDTEYSDALLEDTYWIKKRIEPNGAASGSGDIYEFFVFISVDKTTMRTIIENMMAETLTVVTPTRAQNNAIRRLQQNFFTGF